MADAPPYPQLDHDTDAKPDRGATPGAARWQKAVGIIGLLVVLWVGSQMYDVLYGDIGGGGPGGGHGPGQDAPAENRDQEIDADEGGHDPSQGGHG
jgi:hypothetical protein